MNKSEIIRFMKKEFSINDKKELEMINIWLDERKEMPDSAISIASANYVCPVCGKGRFIGEEWECQERAYAYEGDMCIVCGWFYCSYQYEHPDEGNLINKISFNQAKELYRKGLPLREDDGLFTFPPQYRCACCGYYTLDSIEEYDICPVCFWEDDFFEYEENDDMTCNNVSINEGQENFKKYGASTPERIKLVRPPMKNELNGLERDVWLTMHT